MPPRGRSRPLQERAGFETAPVSGCPRSGSGKAQVWRAALPPFVCVASRGLCTPADLFQRVIASLTRSRRRSAHEKLGIQGPATRWPKSLTERILFVRIYHFAGSVKVQRKARPSISYAMKRRNKQLSMTAF